jgi:hypothetical protein
MWRSRGDARCEPVQDRVGVSAGSQGRQQGLLKPFKVRLLGH